MKNVTFYASSTLIERAKNAQAATQFERRGHRSFTAMVGAGLLQEAERLERMYNEARPFPPIPAGAIQRGRRSVRLRSVDTGLVHESFSQRPSDTDRARGAWLATRFLGAGYDSLAEMIVGGLEHEVQRIERTYNDRKPFPARAAGSLPSGRRPKALPDGRQPATPSRSRKATAKAEPTSEPRRAPAKRKPAKTPPEVAPAPTPAD